MTKFRNAYTPRKREEFQTTLLDEDGNVAPSMTEQSHKDRVDIHNIIQAYDRTGVVQHVSKMRGDYGDFTGVSDYKDALDRVQAAQESFNDLPAKVREAFDNDPAKLLEAVFDDSRKAELQELGLFFPDAEPATNETAPVTSQEDNSGSDPTNP